MAQRFEHCVEISISSEKDRCQLPAVQCLHTQIQFHVTRSRLTIHHSFIQTTLYDGRPLTIRLLLKPINTDGKHCIPTKRKDLQRNDHVDDIHLAIVIGP